MTFFVTFWFELSIWVLFLISCVIAYKRHGRNVFFLFALIILVAFYIETRAIGQRGYDYIDFSYYINMF